MQKITFFKYRLEIGLPKNIIIHTLRSVTKKYEENKQSGKDCLFAGNVNNEYFKLEYIGHRPTSILSGTIIDKEFKLTIITISFRKDIFTNIGVSLMSLFSFAVVLSLLFSYKNTSFIQNILDNYSFMLLVSSFIFTPILILCWTIYLDKKSLFDDFEELFKEQ